MMKRVVGFLLFLWMAACLVGVFKEAGGHQGTRFWVDLGIGAALLAVAAAGLLLAFGKSRPSDVPPDSPD